MLWWCDNKIYLIWFDLNISGVLLTSKLILILIKVLSSLVWCWKLPCHSIQLPAFHISFNTILNTGYNNNNLLHLYSDFLDTQSALHSKGTISSSTTNVQHPPGWCDGSHSAPERPTHTSLLVERRESDEANQCMGTIRRPWWSEASGLVWPGCWGYTPTLFRRTSWDF